MGSIYMIFFRPEKCQARKTLSNKQSRNYLSICIVLVFYYLSLHLPPIWWQLNFAVERQMSNHNGKSPSGIV